MNYKRVRKKLKMTQAQMAEALGISRVTYARYELGEREMPKNVVMLMVEKFGTSSDFLYGIKNDDADMFSSRDGLPPNVNVISPGTKRIPLISGIAAGEPIICEDSFDTYLDIGEHIKADYALRVVGDSMEPLYRNGDIVYIRAQDDVDDGQIAAVCIDDNGTLKRVYHENNGITLISLNPKYSPMHYTPDNSDNIRIVGLAVAYFRVTK